MYFCALTYDPYEALFKALQAAYPQPTLVERGETREPAGTVPFAVEMASTAERMDVAA